LKSRQALKDRLVDTCDHQPFIATAPYLLLFLADYQRWTTCTKRWLPGRARELGLRPHAGRRRPGAGADGRLIAAQTAALAAESMVSGRATSAISSRMPKPT